MKLFLIRHGQTEANLNAIYSGQTDAKLTELGRQQAMSIRPILEKISFDRVYSSDLSRAIDTQMLALPGYTGERLALLREISVGSVGGKSIAEVKAGLEDKDQFIREGYACFGGESIEQLNQRAKDFLKLLEEDPCDCVAAFAHNGILCSTLCAVLGDGIDRKAAASSNCAIHVFEYKKGKWTLRAWNYMGEV